MQEYHLLRVWNKAGETTYHLNTSSIIIGNETLSGINVKDPTMMPHHALLRRVPTVGARDCYSLIANGGQVMTREHGEWVEAKQFQRVLITGDSFQMGETRFSYMIAFMTEAEYAQHFNAQAIDVNSLQKREREIQKVQ